MGGGGIGAPTEPPGPRAEEDTDLREQETEWVDLLVERVDLVVTAAAAMLTLAKLWRRYRKPRE